METSWRKKITKTSSFSEKSILSRLAYRLPHLNLLPILSVEESFKDGGDNEKNGLKTNANNKTIKHFLFGDLAKAIYIGFAKSIFLPKNDPYFQDDEGGEDEENKENEKENDIEVIENYFYDLLLIFVSFFVTKNLLLAFFPGVDEKNMFLNIDTFSFLNNPNNLSYFYNYPTDIRNSKAISELHRKSIFGEKYCSFPGTDILRHIIHPFILFQSILQFLKILLEKTFKERHNLFICIFISIVVPLLFFGKMLNGVPPVEFSTASFSAIITIGFVIDMYIRYLSPQQSDSSISSISSISSSSSSSGGISGSNIGKSKLTNDIVDVVDVLSDKIKKDLEKNEMVVKLNTYTKFYLNGMFLGVAITILYEIVGLMIGLMTSFIYNYFLPILFVSYGFFPYFYQTENWSHFKTIGEFVFSWDSSEEGKGETKGLSKFIASNIITISVFIISLTNLYNIEKIHSNPLKSFLFCLLLFFILSTLYMMYSLNQNFTYASSSSSSIVSEGEEGKTKEIIIVGLVKDLFSFVYWFFKKTRVWVENEKKEN
jgi:hypothetical protein